MSKGDKNGRTNGAHRAHGSKRVKRKAADANRPGNVFHAFGLGDGTPRHHAGDYGGVFRTLRVHTVFDKGKDQVK